MPALSRLTLPVLALVGAIALVPPLAHAADPIGGRWVTQDKDAVVAIRPCGRNLCGTIDRFLVPPPQGADQRDVNNPDPALRKRKLRGLTILINLASDGEVWRGEVYDPKSGRTYRSVVRRKGADALEVKGCFGPLCQTQVWARAR